MFFQPLEQHLASPDQYNIEYEDVYFNTTSELKLHGWWFPANTTESANATVIFLHGNAENISTHSGLVYWLTQHQYDVFIFDYRGYGKSAGEVQIEGILQDISSARKYVASRNPARKKLFIIGHSLGASLGIVNLAENSDDVDGVILVSPFSDYRKVAREMMSKSWLTWAFQWPASLTISDKFNPLDYVDALPNVPKLFIYSEDDRVIQPYHIQGLYEKAQQPKSIVRVNGYHNGIFASKDNQQIILEYLQNWSR